MVITGAIVMVGAAMPRAIVQRWISMFPQLVIVSSVQYSKDTTLSACVSLQVIKRAAWATSHDLLVSFLAFHQG